MTQIKEEANKDFFEPIKLTKEYFSNDIESKIEENLFMLPYYLNMGKIANSNLYSIYSEAYESITYGLYNSGLILLGQLLEVTLKEIIRIKTGKIVKGTFGNALTYTKKKNILKEFDMNFLIYFKNNIRNPYTHRNLNEILENVYLPGWKIPLEGGPENWIETIKKIKEGVKSGKYKPHLIKASEDSTAATIAKTEIDKHKAYFWAWKVFLEFEMLNDIYLTEEVYSIYRSKYGSPLDKIPQLMIEND